jgi:transglutaminase-like putative cysteine protease
MGLFGLATMVDMGGWLHTAASILIITVIAVMVMRVFSRSRFLPTLVGVAAAIVVLIPAFARDDEGNRRFLPTPSAGGDLALAIQEGVNHAATTTAPASATRPFVALLVTSLVVLFLMAEHLAVSWRLVATSGLLLIVPWIPAILFQHRISITALLVAIGAWFATIALARQGPSIQRRPSIPAATTATVATILAVVLVVPTALGGNGWGMIPRFENLDNIDTATRLNLALDLRNSLTSDSQSPVLSYVTTGQRPDTLRLYALTDFNGTAWDPQERIVAERPATTGVLWPLEVSNWAQRPRQRLDITIESLTERNLPMPNAPRTVTVDDGWFYNAELDEVVSDGASTRGLRYDVITDLDYHSARVLQDTQSDIDAGVGDVTDPGYLTIAPAVDLERVQSLSAQLTANATTRYEQAIAIQEYLRDTDEFTYDVTVSPSGGDSISTFLDDRSGYCVQFASAMVIMARSLEIPARMSVGFLSGRADGDGTYVVSGADAHAWPELYFPGHGWVRFEPTPAVQTGSAPEWANPGANQVPVRPEVLEGGQAVPPPRPDTPAGPDVPSAAEDPAPLVSAWVWVGASVAIVVAAIAAMWWRRRRAVSALAHQGPEGAWTLFRERLGDDMAWPVTFTPHEAAEHVESRMRLYGYGLTGAAREALTHLSHAVSHHRYAPHGTTESHERMVEWADEVMVEVEQAREAETTSRPARDGARNALRRGA